jgi:hypothetical protein
MIPIEAKKLEQIEHLIAQSARGIHLLFDNPSIAKVLGRPTGEVDFFSFENITKIQELLTQFIARTSHRAKMEYLNSLEADQYELLVRTYFHILENTVLAATPFKH